MNTKIEKPKMKIEIEAPEKELKEEIEGAKVPKFTISRGKKELFDKLKTPLWKLEDLFLNEQKVRRNSEYTINIIKEHLKNYMSSLHLRHHKIH